MQLETNQIVTCATDHTRLAASDFQPGAVLGGRYKVVSPLGAGGMGVVYRVNQIFLDKQFALKTIDKRHITDMRVRRFQQEARAAFAVDHPNIIAVNDFGLLDDQTPFLVMEIIEGETLADRLKRTGHLTIDEAIPIFVQACFGLAYAHEHGIVHRDIKPSNIMILDGLPLEAEGSVKIVDFGIAKFAQHDDGENQTLTRTGEIFGSPLYMSPEQCAGEQVDHRSDTYSLGCVLFESLSSTPPFVGESLISTMMQHATARAPSLKEASLGTEFPPELEEIVAKMLAKSPQSRYQNLAAVAHALAALNQGGSIATPVKTKPKAPAEAKRISMPNSHFLGLMLAASALSAGLAGVSGYLLHGEKEAILVEDPVYNPDYYKPKVNSYGKSVFALRFPFLDPGKFNDARSAQDGKFEWPNTAQKSLTFQPSPAFLQTPNSFAVFPPNELVELDLKNRHIHDTIPNIMQQRDKLANLQRLYLDGTDITDADLNEIEKLPALSVLSVNSTNIHGSALSNMPQIRKLTEIGFSNCQGATELLAAIKGSQSLKKLEVSGDHLTKADFLTIRSLTSLDTLDVSDNGMKTSDLASLSSSLTGLLHLLVRDLKITTTEGYQLLKTLNEHGLKYLAISDVPYPPKYFITSTFPELKDDEPVLKPDDKRVRSQFFGKTASTAEPQQNKQGAQGGFSFPPDIYVGIIKIGQHDPAQACGKMPAQKNDRVRFYTRYASHDYPEMLDKFGNNDLTGLEVVFTQPEKVIDKIKDWKRLEELSFFNSLVKALRYTYEESPVTDQQLPKIDKLTHLKSLGLCGQLVSGGAIAKMSLLRSLTAIKLRRIKDIEPLLKTLAQCDNIKEVWLVAQDTDNKQLELLTKMKHLETLRIRRSKLNPDSLAIFCRMPALKHLILDRNTWSKQDKERFKKKIRDCQFEPLVDLTYWQLFKPEDQ